MPLIKSSLTGKGSIGQNQESDLDSQPVNSIHDLTISLTWQRFRLILYVMKNGPILFGLKPEETEDDPDRACLELTTSAHMHCYQIQFIRSVTDQVRNGLVAQLKHPAKNYPMFDLKFINLP